MFPASTPRAWTCRCGRRTISSATSTARGSTTRRFRPIGPSYGTFADPARSQPGSGARHHRSARRATQAAPGSIGQKVGDFYKSFMDEARIESLGITPLKGELARDRRASATAATCPAAFARAARIGVRLPFAVNVGAGPAQLRRQYAVQIVAVGARACPTATTTCATTRSSAPSARRTRPTSRGSSRWRNQPDPEGAAARIVALETTLAQQQWDRARNRDRNATYNKMDVASLQAATPHFDWQAYLAALPAGATTGQRRHRPSARLPEGGRRDRRRRRRSRRGRNT